MRKFQIALAILVFPGVIFAKTPTFSDFEKIPEWAIPGIVALAEAEIMQGDDSTKTFRPESPINRAEFCKILVSATKTPIFSPDSSSFPDVRVEDWFAPFVETARNRGWLTGYSDGTFRPGNLINRAEAAKILANAFELEIPNVFPGSPWYEPYFRALGANKMLAHGTDFSTLEPERNPSRAEIADQIFRMLDSRGFFDKNEDEEEVENEEVPAQENLMFEYKDDTKQSLATEKNAGSLEISKNPDLPRRIFAGPGEKNLRAHSLKFTPKNGSVRIAGVSFRRVGNGSFQDFSRVWVELNGVQISDKISPTDDKISIEFDRPVEIAATRTLDLFVDLAESSLGTSSRFVLHLPGWIDANTAKKTGFFPFGGADLVVK